MMTVCEIPQVHCAPHRWEHSDNARSCAASVFCAIAAPVGILLAVFVVTCAVTLPVSLLMGWL